MAKIYVGDIGFVFSLATSLTLTGATAVEVKVQKPSGATQTWVGAIDPLDATSIQYVTVLGNLDEVGLYEVQAHAIVGGKDLLGETTSFTVYAPFQ